MHVFDHMALFVLVLGMSAMLIVPMAQAQPNPTVTPLHCHEVCMSIFSIFGNASDATICQYVTDAPASPDNECYDLGGTLYCLPECTFTTSNVETVTSDNARGFPRDVPAATSSASIPATATTAVHVGPITPYAAQEAPSSLCPTCTPTFTTTSKKLPHFNSSVSACLRQYWEPLTLQWTFALSDAQGRPTQLSYDEVRMPIPHWGITNASVQYYKNPTDPKMIPNHTCASEQECRVLCEDSVRKTKSDKLKHWALPLAGLGGILTGVNLLGLFLTCLARHRYKVRKTKVIKEKVARPLGAPPMVVPLTDGTVTIADPEHDGVTMKKVRVPKPNSAFSLFSGGRRAHETEADTDRRAVSSGSSSGPDGVPVERIQRTREVPL